MALCDRLEAQQKERDTRHAALARAALARFADAPTPANLNFLFHDTYTIEPADLCKSILSLAVQGKLMPQDPNDEPVDKLLSRIAATKLRLKCLISPYAIDSMLSSRVVTAQPNISLTDTREFTIPIPPLAEQRRIIAKADQLMALVDQLEAQLAASRATATSLMNAMVAELTAEA